MKAEIEINHVDHSTIRLDGHDVSMGTRGFALSASVGELPRLELDLVVLDDLRLTGEVEVIVPESTAEALKALGWTPPGYTEMRETPNGEG